MNLREQMDRIYWDVTPGSIPWNLSEPPRLLVDAAQGQPLIDEDFGDRLSNQRHFQARRHRDG